MDARRTIAAALSAAWISISAVVAGQSTFQAVTENFVAYAPDQALARRVARQAEHYRRTLAQEWLGTELPQWSEKCPIQVEIAPLPGGETSFVFVGLPGSSEPSGWKMKVFGPPDRILDSVLPHEVTHTIFATHFRRPLPRWADEGACTTVEHESEREKNHRMLMSFLTARPSRGIPFNKMFTMKQYPHDILPLYAQGYSLARYLIMQRGKQHFMRYIQAGMERERAGSELDSWNQVTRQFYGHRDLSELQTAWIQWVKNGCPDVPNRVVSAEWNQPPQVSSEQVQLTDDSASAISTINPTTTAGEELSWYRQQMVAARTEHRPSAWEATDKDHPASSHQRQELRSALPEPRYPFAPGSTAQCNLAILELVAQIDQVHGLWRAVPRTPAAHHNQPTTWR